MRRGSPWRGKANSASSSRNNIGAGPSRRQHARHEIYDDLLEEALQSPGADDGERPLKRRKSRRPPTEVIVIDDSASGLEDVDIPSQKRKEREVVVIESSRESADDENDDDEMEWDNVDLTALPTSEEIQEPEPATEIREVTLNATPQKSPYLSPSPQFSNHSRKKKSLSTPRTAVSRHIRLEAHKMYLLSLLASFRNLNDLLSSPSLLKILRPYIVPATVNALNAGPEHTQARRTISFLSGLRDVAQSWSERWKETKRGWRRPRWVDPEDLGKVV
jgi:xeroderma pigmentosum group C-complementing protein